MTRPAGAAYRADIDGLRAVAVVAVVLFHAYPNGLPGGFVGVDIFFVISGFLITRIVSGQTERGSFSLRGFYAARVRRIFPALIVVLAPTLVAGWVVLLARDYQALGEQAVAAALFLANLQFWRTDSYFSDPLGKHLLHLWSLGVEEQFYLVWPVALMLVRGRVAQGRLAAAVCALSLLHALWLVARDPTAAFYSPLPRAWELMTGALIALHPVTPGARGRRLLSTAGAALIATALLLIDAAQAFPSWRALLPCVGAAMLIVAGREGWANRLLAWRPAVAIGLISYPLYLWHWPILTLAAELNGGEVPRGVAKIGLLLLAVALATLTYRYVERARWRDRHIGPARLALMMAGVAAAGWAVATSGFSGRAVNRDMPRQFVAAYRRFVKDGVAGPYRLECDFRLPDGRTRAILPAACTAPGARATVLLWGDSHAQALGPGLRAVLRADVAVAQVASGGCPPQLPDAAMPRPSTTCRRARAAGWQAVERLRPQVVVLARRDDHANTDWALLADRLRAKGAQHVVLVGPAPIWRPSLPILVARAPRGPSPGAVRGVEPAPLATDRLLRARYARSPALTYVSATAALCPADRCRAWVPGTRTLTALDDAHLSPAASRWLARTTLAPVLLPLLSPAPPPSALP